MVNHNSAASFGSHFARCGNLRRQGVDVRQNESGQLVPLDGFQFGNAIFFVDSVITEKSQAVSPFLQVLSEPSAVGEHVDSSRQISITKLRRQILGGELQCATIHGACRIPVLAAYRAISLKKRSRHRLGAMLRYGRFALVRDYLMYVHEHRRLLSKDVSVQLAGRITVFRLDRRNDWHVAVVTHEMSMEQGARARNLGFSGQSESLNCVAVGAVVDEGRSHE